MLRVLGLDIGSYAAKATVLGGLAGRQAKLLGLGLAQLPLEGAPNREDDPAPARAAVSQAVKNLAASLRLSAKYVSASVGGDSVVVKKISLPAAGDSGLRAAILAEAEQGLPFPLAEASVSHQVLARDPDTGHLSVLLAAARNQAIRNRLEVMAEAGLKPAVIDVDGLALCNAYEFVNPGHGDNVVLADIGAGKIAVAVLHNGLPLVIRDEPGGGRNLTDDIGGRCNLSRPQAEAVKFGAEPAPNPGEAAEAVDRAAADWMAAVERVLAAARQEAADYQPSRICLSGGSSLIPGLADEFAKHFNIETQVFNPLLSAAYNPRKFDTEYLRHVGPQMAVSFGLALRKADFQ
ncbi:MAG: pilus assembly protein PilM [Candidatus Adiutrix sp.]|jgi:type IV pilus assembly protein PilM|nr:pilus assembly protein PilM [Candidatus Adiutrix sp.]